MVMEMEPDMDRVLQGFDVDLLLLDGHARGSSDSPCESASASVGPQDNNKEAVVGGEVKERIARALRIYKDAATAHEHEHDAGGSGTLLQVWAPARDGERRVLATRGQPFVLPPPRCHRLFQYRTVSLTHAFPVGGSAAAVPGERGLPGRVFDARELEWTPNVQYYGTGEYARISYALIYDIQAALALPILDPATGSCLAVLELVTTEPRLHFAAEVDSLSKALQAVELRGSEICRYPAPEVCNDDETAAAQVTMSEVAEILRKVGEAHSLPLAQAWARCRRCSTGTERASLTAAGTPFYIAADADPALLGFHEACVEHHLRPGRGGLVEEAAVACRPRFCADVTKYSMDAYPLAHHARFCGLAGCLAVCAQLRRGDGASMDMDGGGWWDECVLEFFFPPDCRDGEAQKETADAVAATIMERFGNGDLKAVVISGLQDLAFEIVADGEGVFQPDPVTMADAPELELNYHGGDERDSDEEGLHLVATMGTTTDIEALKMRHDEHHDGEDPRSQAGKKTAKRKGEKTVSLEELQRYFSGSLKDAAKSLGVCPTTMKRICRQHGISRWPFRKLAKANRSLDKIKRVFESVQASPNAMPASAPAVAAAVRRAPALPCLSSAPRVASSQSSCQAPPPPLKEATWRKPLHGQDAGVVTVKANYRGDIVRFRVPSSAGVATVKGEVAKRLGLEAGEFDVKYLDDDSEWVLLSCDADFQECLDVVPALSGASTSSGSGTAQPVVRLMVQEIHGSSCGSSD